MLGGYDGSLLCQCLSLKLLSALTSLILGWASVCVDLSSAACLVVRYVDVSRPD
jgi:hypothetical protein